MSYYQPIFIGLFSVPAPLIDPHREAQRGFLFWMDFIRELGVPLPRLAVPIATIGFFPHNKPAEAKIPRGNSMTTAELIERIAKKYTTSGTERSSSARTPSTISSPSSLIRGIISLGGR